MQKQILFRRSLATLCCGALSASAAFAQTSLHTFPGLSANERFGMSVASAGDVNADGKLDIVAGAPEDGMVFGLGEGMARVYSGNGGSLLFTLNGGVLGDGFGTAVAGAGHVNLDAYADIVVGAPMAGAGGSMAGRVYVYSGQTGLVLNNFVFDGAAADDRFGAAVASAGDVNNDGFDDIIAGAPMHDAGGADRGMARVFSGQNGMTLFTLVGTVDHARFGFSVAGAGDLNGDGRDEFIVGSLLDGARVYSGQTGSVMYTYSASIDDRLGSSVAGAGLVDADAVPDVIVGATQDGNLFMSGTGYARVYSGASGTILLTLNGVAVGDRFGHSVGNARDINGDGRSELIVGADQYAYGGDGYVQVFNGNGGGLLHTFLGSSASERFGFDVDGLGDINTDGGHEFIMGAPNRSGNSGLEGVVQVWSEGAQWQCPPPTNYCTPTVNSTGQPALTSNGGTTSISANNLVLLASGCPANKLGLFIYGPNQANAPLANGVRCVGNPFIRLPMVMGDSAGNVAFNVDYNALPPWGLITSGSVQNFQFWYRDPDAGGANANLSDGRSITFCP